MSNNRAFATNVAVIIVVILVVASIGVGYFALNPSTPPSSTSSFTTFSTSTSATTFTPSSTTLYSTTNTSVSCPTSAFGKLAGVAGNGTNALSYNPLDLFANFSSMSIAVVETANGTSAFSLQSTYLVVGTPMINGTKFVEVNFTDSIAMATFGASNVLGTAWFAPDGNATKLVEGSAAYSGQTAATQGISLTSPFTSLLSIGQILASNFPSNAFSVLNKTTINLGQTQVKVTNYAISNTYIQSIESLCPSVNVSSVNLAWQSGVVGATNILTYFNFSTATSATSSFGISEQVVSLTKAA